MHQKVLQPHPRRSTVSAALLLLSMFAVLAAFPAHAESERDRKERVAVLPLWVFDSQGRPIPSAAEADVARLSSVLPRAISARIIQSGKYEAWDPPLLESRGISFHGATEIERVRQALEHPEIDQVLTGTIAQVERSVILSLRRYTMAGGKVEAVGASVVRATSASEAINHIDTLLIHAFPPDVEVVNRPIARVVIVPSQLRIPVGGTAHLTAYALDEFGRPMPTVHLVYQVEDESKASVDPSGAVLGLSPGRTAVRVQVLGRPAPSGALPQAEVNVVGPSLGVRAGVVQAQGAAAPRLGLRLIPSTDFRTPTRPPAQDLPQAGANPTNVLTTFFTSLLGNGLLTLDLDIDPGQSLSVTLDAVQRSVSGFFGTGIGAVVPLAEAGPSGVNLRLTFGTQLRTSPHRGMTIPIEVNVDFVLGSAQIPPKARLGVSAGFDIFQ